MAGQGGRKSRTQVRRARLKAVSAAALLLVLGDRGERLHRDQEPERAPSALPAWSRSTSWSARATATVRCTTRATRTAPTTARRTPPKPTTATTRTRRMRSGRSSPASVCRSAPRLPTASPASRRRWSSPRAPNHGEARTASSRRSRARRGSGTSRRPKFVRPQRCLGARGQSATGVHPAVAGADGIAVRRAVPVAGGRGHPSHRGSGPGRLSGELLQRRHGVRRFAAAVGRRRTA